MASWRDVFLICCETITSIASTGTGEGTSGASFISDKKPHLRECGYLLRACRFRRERRCHGRFPYASPPSSSFSFRPCWRGEQQSLMASWSMAIQLTLVEKTRVTALHAPGLWYDTPLFISCNIAEMLSSLYFILRLVLWTVLDTIPGSPVCPNSSS